MNIHMNRVRVYVRAVAAAGVKIESVSKGPNGFLTDSGSMAIEEANDAGSVIPAIKAAARLPKVEALGG